ncbi:GFA family protein [Algicella marina]|uniref:GFA family protein n=1 Tax=Algicella marina TaxID=2683284 RepID=A0A6P1T157_9RHOB|nr:GFA family protein [Algicella marina]QHQ35550.1 GFA family protein [Algicella marina]
MNRTGCVETGAFRGACQCGAVRYHATQGAARHTVCHCRMCQRATGNAFAPLLEVENSRITWQGSPKSFRSSSIAERGFCANCGTPIFYRQIGADSTEFMVGTIDTPIEFTPVANHGAESRLAWVFGLAAVAEQETVASVEAPVVSHQYEHGD